MPQNHPRITALSPAEVFTCGLLVKLSLTAWRAVRFKAKNSNSTLSLASHPFLLVVLSYSPCCCVIKTIKCLHCKHLHAQRFGDKDEFLNVHIYIVQIYKRRLCFLEIQRQGWQALLHWFDLWSVESAQVKSPNTPAWSWSHHILCQSKGIHIISYAV